MVVQNVKLSYQRLYDVKIHCNPISFLNIVLFKYYDTTDRNLSIHQVRCIILYVKHTIHTTLNFSIYKILCQFLFKHLIT